MLPDSWCLMQKQALLHDQSKQKGKADAPPLNGASGPGSDGSEAEEGGSSRDKGEQTPAVQTAEPNEPIGIITIEDVLEELIGQVWLHCIVGEAVNTRAIIRTDMLTGHCMQTALLRRCCLIRHAVASLIISQLSCLIAPSSARGFATGFCRSPVGCLAALA